MDGRVGIYHKIHCDEDDGTILKIEYFGFGVYLGEEVPPPGIKFLGIDLHSMGEETPKFQLDTGEVIWGCECSWRDEEIFKKEIEGKELVQVSITEIREKL